MSAPKTNLQKQKRRHWGPLLGIAIVLIAATILILWLLGHLADTDTPETAPVPAVEEEEGGLPAGGQAVTPTSPDATDATTIEQVPTPAGD